MWLCGYESGRAEDRSQRGDQRKTEKKRNDVERETEENDEKK